ncbi:unnamed protein product [Ectocarpus sp. CCAP 1310/34]|nr:unnamed protein product [Ectocarpus sp. CCAP 1310/34]
MSAALGPRYDRPLDNDDDNVLSEAAEGPAQGVHSWLEILRRSSMFTLALLTLVVVLLFADQNLLAPNLSAIAEEFGFNEEEKDRHLGGDIAVAFFGFGAPASVLVGWLTDVIDRRKLFVAIVALGEMGTLATVFVTTFSQLFWTRAITGVAIGGGMPLVYSILGDLVSSTGRTEASGLIGIAIGMGLGLGQVVAGFTGSSTSLGWRLPFLLMALPCFALALLVLVATRDPARGRLEAGLQEHFRAGGEYNERLNLNGLLMLAKSPTVLLVLAQGVPGTLPWGVITVFLPDYLHKQRGMSIKTATVVGMVFGAATVAGQVVGAKVGQNLYNRRPENQALLMGVSTAGTLPCVMMIRYSGGIFGVYALYAMAGGFLAAMTGPNIRSVMMNVTLPSTRGTAFGVFNVFDDLGKGLGPAMVSLVVASRGREDAFTLAILGWLACGTMLLAMALTVHRDEQKVQCHLAEYGRHSSVDTDGGAPEPQASVGPTMLGRGVTAATKYAALSDHITSASTRAGTTSAQGGDAFSDGEMEVELGVFGPDGDQPRRRLIV